ncbi:uncharacterized protein LOC134258254 [Saccostrea cucullata]|uniref:uncharacterized protein LOC134258254 n=1 Tax=Saccostrea cuccullata TaxID=36930 RepID=UPI002ED33650
MASKNVSHLIEKEVWTRALQGTWNNDDSNLKEDGEEETFYENSFTEVKNHGHTNEDLTPKAPAWNVDFVTSEKNSVKNSSENTDSDASEKLRKMTLRNNKDDPSSPECLSSVSNKEDRKGEKLRKETTDKSIDEVDYFDSEEEYMETHGQKYDERNPLDFFEGLSHRPLQSRYSGGVEQFRNIPVYRRSIQEFAATNHFDVYDVVHDGNCMFRAIADQFMINGRIGYTPERLRCAAIDYLRKNPYKRDGEHIQSFLCTESWQDYLSRMSKSNEWSDHIILQAVVDAYNLEVVVINVFLEDIRKTVVKPENKRNRTPLQFFLGHLGEFHYLSLRPDHWASYWPYKSLLYRLMVCSNRLTPTARQELIQNKITEMGASDLVNKEEFLDMIQLPGGNRDGINTDPEMPLKQKDLTESHGDNLFDFDSYCLEELQLQETEDSSESVLFDPLHIDILTGIPLPHLSYIIKQLFPLHMISSYRAAGRQIVFPDITLHCIGSYADGINVFLKDISKNQSKRSFYNSEGEKSVGEVVIIPRDKHVRHCDKIEGQTSVVSIFADSTNTHPGYCQLKLAPYAMGIREKNILCRGSDRFLKEIEVDAVVSLQEDVQIKYTGLFCDTFPPLAQEWKNRRRKFTFPSHKLIEKVLRMKCTLIKKAHPRSKDPDIEWKYNFSMAEQAVIVGLSTSQYHGLSVFKVLVENMTIHLMKKLKNKHLKAVYLRTLEDIPCAAWETNFSGCLLYTVSALVDYLKVRFLPHYFIPANNLIECYSTDEIEAIRVNVECIRLFPLTVIQNIAENHGYHYAPKLIQMAFVNCRTFRDNKDLMTVFMNAFTPGTVCSVKVMTRLGCYGTALQLLRYTHEQMLLMPMPTDCYEMPSFLEFFHMALKSLRQKSSRIILAKLFDILFKTDISQEIIDDDATYALNILPWTVDFKIGWTEIPVERSTDFFSLADFFYGYSAREFDKRNSTLSELAILTAIRCVKEEIKTETIILEEIEDASLKEEIKSQRDQMIRNLKKRLKTYYIHMYAISMQYLTFEPLQHHMDDIEKLSDEFPEMALSVSSMFRYLERQDKALEYERRYNTSFQWKKHAGTYLP